MRCRRTGNGDLSQLKALWKQGFGDTDAQIDRFFEQAYPHCIGFAAEENGRLCAALYALPQTLCRNEQPQKMAYLYAVTTAPELRGRGICRTLMAYAEKTLRKQWFCCTMLVPGESSLFGFYESLGYHAQHAHTIRKLPQPPVCCGQAQRLELQSYAGLRETLLSDRAHVRYDAHWLAYAGAAFYALTLNGQLGCAAVLQQESGSCVYEILPGVQMLPALSNVLEQKPLLVRAPGDTEAFSMLKWLDAPQHTAPPVYLSFAFE